MKWTETNNQINQKAEQRSCIEGKENEKSLNTNIKIKNKTEDEEHKTTNGTTEEQAEINTDVEYSKIQLHNEYKNDEICIGQEVIISI